VIGQFLQLLLLTIYAIVEWSLHLRLPTNQD